MDAPLLSVDGLTVRLATSSVEFDAVSDVTFSIGKGEVLCLVGESGCGKSMTALALLRLLPEVARVGRGVVTFEGRDVGAMTGRELTDLRGGRVGMVFQEPMTSLNPVLRVGDQIAEVLVRHRALSRRDARARSVGLMRRVGIPEPEVRFDEYPHRLSGGLRQRVMIAAALACDPSLLIADEPTTALDVTVQGQILTLLKSLARDRGMGVLFITHDLGVVARMATDVGVMYAGRLVEYGPAERVLRHPLHPYTRGLVMAMPRLGAGRRGPLHMIGGTVPSAGELAVMTGCPFRPRCGYVAPACSAIPRRRSVDGRLVACARLPGESCPDPPFRER